MRRAGRPTLVVHLGRIRDCLVIGLAAPAGAANDPHAIGLAAPAGAANDPHAHNPSKNVVWCSNYPVVK